MIEPFLLLFIFLLFAIPGIIFGFALLHRITFSRLEKTLIGVVLGILLPPTLAILEFQFLGLRFNTGVVLFNILLVFIAGIALMFRNHQIGRIPGELKDAFNHWSNVKHDWRLKAVFAVLLLIAVYGFWLRVNTSWAPNFFEFDPYYYDQLTRMLVETGQIPVESDLSYFPEMKSHREFPVIHYLTGGWFLLHQDFSGSLFDKTDMILIIQLYPPLVAVFLVWLAFLYLKEEYGPYVGLTGAALLTVMPQLVSKFAAGVSEQAPFGIFISVAALIFFGLALGRKSVRLGLIAGLVAFLSVTGSAHHIWPFTVLAAYIALQAMVDFLSHEMDKTYTEIYLLFGGGALFGNILLAFYRVAPVSIEFITSGTQLVVLSAVFALFLYALAHFRVGERLKLSSPKLMALVLILGSLVLFISPLGSKFIGIANSSLGYATVSNALYKTVQEGAATNPGFYRSAFGEFNPEQVLLMATLMAVLSAFVVIWRRVEKQYAATFLIVALFLIFFNSFLDSLLTVLANAVGSSLPALATLIGFLTSSDVFIFLIVSLGSMILLYAYSEKRDRLALLTILIFFPVAYIGLNRVKFLVHLAVALGFAIPFILGELKRTFETLNDNYQLMESKYLRGAMTVIVLLTGLILFNMQLPIANAASNGLQYSRISPDWMESLDWMKDHLSDNDRVISWWDYGHWIVFFGESKTVLDPGNVHPDFDQQTAHGFVNGNTQELINTMKQHGATYLLADAELVPKWGALNYLSGTYSGPENGFTPSIANWDAGPGQSEYETEHAFEQIYSVFQPTPGGDPQRVQCPGVIPRAMMYSGFGAFYCLDNNGGLSLLIKPGEEKALNNPQLVSLGGDSRINAVPLSSTGFLYNSNAAFMNLNPDLETLTDGRLKSHLFEAAFVQLFFFGTLEGFEHAYTSPNGQVKIFKLVA
ncbi:hypothetical protein KJ765_01195 [Candidatus Micrarchaeota archaeon]|nr:hypothetical protein [Candidatus Micrarchaeota archaeon]